MRGIDQIALHVDAEPPGERTVLVLDSELDAYTAHRPRDAVHAVPGTGRHDVVLDCRLPAFPGSAPGLAARRVRRSNGPVTLAFLPENLMKIFRITGLSRIFSFAPDGGTGS